jgi:hypothetical protein
MQKIKIIYWLPRVLAILIVLFFGIFILEGFSPEFSWQDSLSHLFTALVILGLTIVAWKWPKIGGWFFVILGIFFGVSFHPLWWGFSIGSIPLLAGILFLIEKSK